MILLAQMNTEFIARNPLGFVGACLVWIPLAIWIIAVIQWMIAAEIDVITGFVSLGVAFCLGYFTSNPPQPWIGHLFFFTSIATVCAFPFVRAGFTKRHLNAIDVDLMKESYELLRMKKNHSGAMLKMARILADKGHFGQAIPVADQALQGLPAAHFHIEIAEVKGWRTLVNPATVYKLYCAKCDAPSPAGTLFCPRCDHELLLDLISFHVMPAGKGRRLLTAWVILAALILIIPLATEFLPLGAALLVIIGTLALGGFVAIRALFTEEEI